MPSKKYKYPVERTGEREINGWTMPTGISSWEEFVEFRVSLGFSPPQPRKALYLTDERTQIRIGRALIGYQPSSGDRKNWMDGFNI